MGRITAIYAALLALLMLALAARVVRRRLARRIGVGTGGDAEMERAVRVHANFVEYVPMALLLLLLNDLAGLSPVALHVAGATLVGCRLLHAYGLSNSSGKSTGRFIGTLGTWLVIVSLAGVLLARSVVG